MKICSIYYAPLLLGHTQIRKITNAHQELVIKELYLREIIVNKKELIIRMKDEKKKYFNPKFLVAADWSKNSLDTMLVKLSIM